MMSLIKRTTNVYGVEIDMSKTGNFSWRDSCNSCNSILSIHKNLSRLYELLQVVGRWQVRRSGSWGRRGQRCCENWGASRSFTVWRRGRSWILRLLHPVHRWAKNAWQSGEGSDLGTCSVSVGQLQVGHKHHKATAKNSCRALARVMPAWCLNDSKSAWRRVMEIAHYLLDPPDSWIVCSWTVQLYVQLHMPCRDCQGIAQGMNDQPARQFQCETLSKRCLVPAQSKQVDQIQARNHLANLRTLMLEKCLGASSRLCLRNNFSKVSGRNHFHIWLRRIFWT